MKLIIQQYKCHSEVVEFEFLENNITLLTGPSGTGKTTIFNAILWCLYGGDGFKPNKPDNSKSTTIIIIFSNLWIKRTGKKIIEMCTKDNQILTNESAQGYIDNLFGNKNLWLSSSYILQDERNILLTSSGKEKFSILHEIAFGSDTEYNRPEFYTKRIEDINKDVKNLLSVKTNEINMRYSNYMSIYNQNKHLIEYDSPLNIEKLNLLKTSKGEILSNLKSEMLKIIKLEAEFTSATNLYNSINKEIQELETPEAVDEIYLAKLEEQLLRSQHISKLKTRKTEIDHIPPNYQELLEEARNNLSKRKTFDQKYISIYGAPIQGALKSKENICAELLDLQNLDYENKVAAYNQYCVDKQTYDLQIKNIISETENKWQKECQELKDKYNISLKEKTEIENKNNLLKKDYQNKEREILLRKQHYDEKLKEYHRIIHLYQSLTDHKTESEKKLSEIDFSWWFNKFPNEELTDVNISHKSKQYRDLFCPHCGGSITYSNNELHKGHFTQEEQEETISKLQEVENKLKLYKEYTKTIERDINSLNQIGTLPLLPEHSIEELPSLILLDVPIIPTLSLPIYNKPTLHQPPQAVDRPPNNPQEKILKLQELLVDIDLESTSHYQNIINKYQLGYELDKIKEELSKYEDIEIDDLTVNVYRLKVKKYKDYCYRFEYLTSKLRELQIPSLPEKSSSEFKNEITLLEEELSTLDKQINFSQVNNQLNDEKLVMDNITTEINNLTDYEHSINYLKQIISETSNSALENVVNEINVITNNILEYIFNNSITVLLRTTKESKTRDETKLIVNLQIHYQGAIYDDIREVSGGEGKRISFALTVALSKVCESPILLLDECIDNFETKMREKCLKVLRQYLPEKTIIHISHFGNEGRYDKVIDLTKEESETYEI